MAEFDLVERYIYAVTKKLPHKARKDIAEELRQLILDMLEQRCGEVVPSEHDIRVVLAELGTPSGLSEKYSSDKHSALIGPPYYRTYKFVLKIVLLAVSGGLLIAFSISALLGEGANLFLSILSYLGSLIHGGIFAFGFVTILFAFFERKGIKLNESDESLSSLPPVPKHDERITRAEPIFGIAFSLVFLVAFLFASPWVIGMLLHNGQFIPLFNQETLLRLWPLTAIVFAASTAKEGFKLHEGRYTSRLAIAMLVLNLISFTAMALLMSREGLINEAFLAACEANFHEAGSFMQLFFRSIQTIMVALMGFAVLLETIDGFIKARRYTKG
ncbi:MAG: hypothetical protein BWY62_00586 [Firmicutes bacterium ADurb.Bin356]|nr:MAG: hypothetical protein BWY62_00586 [Firmicutes bacterium ADurb.Bin356]